MLRLQEESQWDEFVYAHPDATPFHLTAWKNSIVNTFGFEPFYLVAFSQAQIRGILPLFLVKNPIVRKCLISSPFAVYGGVLGDSQEVRDAFHHAVRELGEKLGVQYVELRNWKQDQILGFSSVPRYVTFLQEVGPDEDQILAAIPRKTRAMVRKSLTSNLESRVTRELGAFEDLYSRNLRRLGTPAFPKQHFKELLAQFKEQCDIREVVKDGRVIAAVMTFYFRDRMVPYYGASNPEFNSLGPNNFMYFDLMRWGGQQGYRLFDFGRSKRGVPGSYDFKAHWGMAEEVLPYEILPVRRTDVPNFSPANPKFSAAIRVWQKVPLPLTRWVGPSIVRWFP